MTDTPHPDDHDDLLAFTPVPVALRADGWTPDRQRAFVAALLATGSVAKAAAVVGMSPATAYRLRKRPGAGGFARAWDAALDEASDRALEHLIERARSGMHGLHFYRGRFTGHTLRYDDRDLIGALTRLGRRPAGEGESPVEKP